MNLSKKRKDEILWMDRNKCKHGHTYLEHRACMLKENPDKTEIVGHLDIEASNLAADFGLMVSWAIKVDGGEKVYHDLLKPKDLKGDLDKRITRSLIECMYRFDRIVTYYGTGFDIPFIRSRAEFHDIPFPEHGQIFHTDVYYTVRNKLRLHRSRLATACDFFDIPSKNHPLIGEVWVKALGGNRQALRYILDHNIEDVESLERLYRKLSPYIILNKRSI